MLARYALALFLPCIGAVDAANDLPIPQAIGGSLVIHGGGPLAEKTITDFIASAGGAKAVLVVIPTAAAEPDLASAVSFWEKRGLTGVHVLHTRDRKRADSDAFIAPLLTASAVWISGGLQQRLEEAYVGTAAETALLELLQRGGVIGGSSAGAAFLSRTMIRSGKAEPAMGTGLDGLPFAIIDQHFSERDRSARLITAVAMHPQRVGYGIDEGTALHVQHRSFHISGRGKVHVFLPAGAGREARRFALQAGQPGDHLALARAAIARSGKAFPPKTFAPREVSKGTLVLVGGGAMPRRAFENFLRAAGGEHGRIVIITSALNRQQRAVANDAKLFARLGAKNLVLLHASSRAEANDAKFVEQLESAGGVWFSGGRQWRLADRYLGTQTEAALRRVLERGGAIGGTSAGASFLADYLVRGNPLHSSPPMAEGYEHGLALLPGTAIDQHVTRRHRLPDLLALKRHFPQLLVIGIDESTAAIVRGTQLEVSGIGAIRVLDRVADASREGEQFTLLKSGDRYNLRELKASDDPLIERPH